jgi:hypothetical protein
VKGAYIMIMRKRAVDVEKASILVVVEKQERRVGMGLLSLSYSFFS